MVKKLPVLRSLKQIRVKGHCLEKNREALSERRGSSEGGAGGRKRKKYVGE